MGQSTVLQGDYTWKNEYVFIEYGTMYRMAVAKEHPAQYSR